MKSGGSFFLIIYAAGILLLGGWIGGVAWLTDYGIREFERHTFTDPAHPDAPQPWRERRFFADPDAYAWLSHARDLRASSDWRLRFTRMDNAPYGREMHWAHLPLWLLNGISAGLETFAGLPPDRALELAGRILMPLTGWLFFSALFVSLGRGFGLPASALITTLLVVTLHWEFHTLRPDHHGFHLAFAVAMWCCLYAGGPGRQVNRNGSGGQAGQSSSQRWFFAAGLLGGVALWLGATVFLFVLATTALAAASWIMFMPRHELKHAWPLSSSCWRIWGVTGAATGLIFYLLEYAPGHFSMRLEVNHPLYALCWLAVAETLRALMLYRAGRARPVAMALPLIVAGVLPLLIIAGPASWFLPRTTLMLRLHAEHINEFKTLFASQGDAWLGSFIKTFGVALLAFPVAVFLWSKDAVARVAMISGFVLVICFMALFFRQVRWEPFALAVAILFALAVMHAWLRWLAAQNSNKLFAVRYALVSLVVINIIFASHRILDPLRALVKVEKMDASWLNAFLQRNLFVQWTNVAGGQPARMMITAEMAPAAYYFGAGAGVGSLYWENNEGLADAAAFFGDALPGDKAKEISRKRAITHAMMKGGANDAVMFYHLAQGRMDHPGAAQTVGGAMAGAGTEKPGWLKLESDWMEDVSPTYLVFVPAIGQYVPTRLEVVIYTPRP